MHHFLEDLSCRPVSAFSALLHVEKMPQWTRTGAALGLRTWETTAEPIGVAGEPGDALNRGWRQDTSIGAVLSTEKSVLSAKIVLSLKT